MSVGTAVRHLIALRARLVREGHCRAALLEVDFARQEFCEAVRRDDGRGPAQVSDVAALLGAEHALRFVFVVLWLHEALRARERRDGPGFIRAAENALKLVDPEPLWPIANFRLDNQQQPRESVQHEVPHEDS